MKFYLLTGIPIAAGEEYLLLSLVDADANGANVVALYMASVLFSTSIYSISALSNGPLGLKLIALQSIVAL